MFGRQLLNGFICVSAFSIIIATTVQANSFFSINSIKQVDTIIDFGGMTTLGHYQMKHGLGMITGLGVMAVWRNHPLALGADFQYGNQKTPYYHSNTYLMTINGYYRFLQRRHLQPYMGVGVGFGSQQYGYIKTYNDLFIYQAEWGFSYRLRGPLQLQLESRWLGSASESHTNFFYTMLLTKLSYSMNF